VIAVVLGTLIANEPFSGRVVVAAVMVLAGVAVVRRAAPPASGARRAT
jgi:drug/metabolite transporter (DMT)-like permease